MNSTKNRTTARSPFDRYKSCNDKLPTFPAREWKNVLTAVQDITAKISHLAQLKNKIKIKKKQQNHSRLKSCSRKESRKKLMREKTEKSIANHECTLKKREKTPCHYFQEYEKMKKKNELLTVEKNTLEKLLISNIKNSQNQQTVNPQFEGKRITLMNKQNHQRDCSSISIRKDQKQQSDLHRLMTFSVQTNDKSSERKKKNHQQISILPKTIEKESQQLSSYDPRLVKLEKEFNRLLQLNRLEKNKVRKKVIRKEMQEIATQMKLSKIDGV